MVTRLCQGEPTGYGDTETELIYLIQYSDNINISMAIRLLQSMTTHYRDYR